MAVTSTTFTTISDCYGCVTSILHYLLFVEVIIDLCFKMVQSQIVL